MYNRGVLVINIKLNYSKVPSIECRYHGTILARYQVPVPCPLLTNCLFINTVKGVHIDFNQMKLHPYHKD